MTIADKGLVRGPFGQIPLRAVAMPTRRSVERLVAAAAEAQHIDEHGGWNFGHEFDSHHRGWALNWDLYGVGRDHHSRRLLAVVQIRQYVKRAASHTWGNVRKNYYLIGRNEDDTVFAHPVSAGVVRSAVSRKRSVVQAVQDWLWDADYRHVIRQGDVGIVPVRVPRGVPLYVPMMLDGSHRLEGTEFRRDDRCGLYVRDPHIVHVPGTHPDVSAEGWTRVAAAKRAKVWDFAAPTVD